MKEEPPSIKRKRTLFLKWFNENKLSEQRRKKMTNKVYDIFKNTSLVVAPFTVFVAAVMNIWHIPYAAEVTATLAAVDVFIGAVVVIAANRYKKSN